MQINLLDHNLQLVGCTVTSPTVKKLGVILNSNLSFEKKIIFPILQNQHSSILETFPS